jgi:hypothetical protein
MGKQPAEKDKSDKHDKHDKPHKPEKPAKPAPAGDAQAKPKKAKPAPDAAAGKEKDKPKEEKAKPAPRPPADLRLKVLKKFYGKFLPKGPLRDRHKTLMARWTSGDDHGGVTLEELKSLYEDWKSARAKRARPAHA